MRVSETRQTTTQQSSVHGPAVEPAGVSRGGHKMTTARGRMAALQSRNHPAEGVRVAQPPPSATKSRKQKETGKARAFRGHQPASVSWS